MNFRRIGVVYRKELIDTLRDRRTLIYQVVLPILAFPLLMVGFFGIAILFAQRAAREDPTVMVLGGAHGPELTRRLQEAEDLKVVPEEDDYAQRIGDKKLRAALRIPEGFEQRLIADPSVEQTLTVYHFERELRSRAVLRRVRRVIREFTDAVVQRRITEAGLTQASVTPFEITRQNVASAEKVSGNIAGILLPYFIIFLCFNGAMLPAMDLTAGEKERGTLETLLAAPARRTDLVLGKFLLVLTSSLVTCFLAVTSLSITIIGGTRYFSQVSADMIAISISWRAMATVFLLVLPLAVLFSSVLLAVAVLARSFREAQSQITPLIFIVILPAMAAFIPGLDLTPRLALVPILNVSLVSKEILAGNYPWGTIGLIFASTTFYAAVALRVAIRQFQKEQVLFRS